MFKFQKQPVAINAPYHGEWDATVFKRVDGNNFSDQNLAATAYTSSWQQKYIQGSNAPYAPARTAAQQVDDATRDFSIIDYNYLNFPDSTTNTQINKQTLGTHTWLYYDSNDVVWKLKAVFTPNSSSEHIQVEIFNVGEFGRIGGDYPTINRSINSFTITPTFHNPSAVTSTTWTTSFVNGFAQNFSIEPNPDGSEVHLHFLCNEDIVFANTPFWFTNNAGSLVKSYLACIVPITISGAGTLSSGSGSHGSGLTVTKGTERHSLHTGLAEDQFTDNDISYNNDSVVDNRTEDPSCPPHLTGELHFYDDSATGSWNTENTTYSIVMRSIWDESTSAFIDIKYQYTRNDTSRGDRYYYRHYYIDYVCNTPTGTTEVSFDKHWYDNEIRNQTHTIQVGTTTKSVAFSYNKQFERVWTDYYGNSTDTSNFSGSIDGVSIPTYTEAINYVFTPFITFGGIAGLSVTNKNASPDTGFVYIISPNEDNERIPTTGWSSSQVQFSIANRAFVKRKFDPKTGALLDNGAQKF